MAELADVLCPREIAQPVPAQIEEPRSRREVVFYEVPGGLRDHRLATVCQITKTRAAVQRQPDIGALVAQLHLAGVHADPESDRSGIGPLQREGSRDGI